MTVQLYTYWRSSAAWRVRIALNLKNISHTLIPVHLLKDGGGQHTPEYAIINPMKLVPALVHDGQVITQSSAIIEYLDEIHPEPPLLSQNPAERARARQFAQTIACDIHPVNNLRILQYLGQELGATDEQKTGWYVHWLKLGLAALEKMADPDGPYAMGGQLTIADIFLIPQLYNARRYGFALSDYPRLNAIEQACVHLEAFMKADAHAQPDAEV